MGERLEAIENEIYMSHNSFRLEAREKGIIELCLNINVDFYNDITFFVITRSAILKNDD